MKCSYEQCTLIIYSCISSCLNKMCKMGHCCCRTLYKHVSYIHTILAIRGRTITSFPYLLAYIITTCLIIRSVTCSWCCNLKKYQYKIEILPCTGTVVLMFTTHSTSCCSCCNWVLRCFLTSQVISIPFYMEHEKSDKFKKEKKFYLSNICEFV